MKIRLILCAMAAVSAGAISTNGQPAGAGCPTAGCGGTACIRTCYGCCLGCTDGAKCQDWCDGRGLGPCKEVEVTPNPPTTRLRPGRYSL